MNTRHTRAWLELLRGDEKPLVQLNSGARLQHSESRFNCWRLPLEELVRPHVPRGDMLSCVSRGGSTEYNHPVKFRYNSVQYGLSVDGGHTGAA